MASHNEFGKNAEVIAKAYLQRKGFEILEENWQFKKAEIDIIALIDETLIFVEVKARSGNSFGEPEDFVNAKKQQLMSFAADEYIFLKDHEGEIRFDIISILFTNAQEYTLKHIEDAFWNY